MIPRMEPVAPAAETSIPAPSKAAVTRARLGINGRRGGLLQGQPVIRNLHFHLLHGGRQLVGAKEDDPAQEDHDDDSKKAEEWLAHV